MNNAVKQTINEDPRDRRCNHCSVDGEPTLLVVRTLGISRRDSGSFVLCVYDDNDSAIQNSMLEEVMQEIRARKGSGAEAYALTHHSHRQMELEQSDRKPSTATTNQTA